jgi:hypothetical protein
MAIASRRTSTTSRKDHNHTNARTSVSFSMATVLHASCLLLFYIFACHAPSPHCFAMAVEMEDVDIDITARRNTRFRPTNNGNGFATTSDSVSDNNNPNINNIHIEDDVDVDVEDDAGVAAVGEKDEEEDDTPPSFPTTPLMFDTTNAASDNGGFVDLDVVNGEAEAQDETVTPTATRVIIKYKRQQRTQFRERVQQLLTRQQQRQDNDADAEDDNTSTSTSLVISTVSTEFGLRQPNSGTNRLKPKNHDNKTTGITATTTTPRRDPTMRNGLRPAGGGAAPNNEEQGFAGNRGNGGGGRTFKGKRPPPAKVNLELEELDSIVMTLTKEDLDYLKSQSSGMIESMEVDAIRMPFYNHDHASILDEEEDEDEQKEQDTTSTSNSTSTNNIHAKQLNNRNISKKRRLDKITYGVTDVQAPELWSKGLDGSGQKVCILDTGVDLSHTDLNGNKFTGTNQHTSTWNQDQCGHGTHVAGVIAAKAGNGGVKGIAYNANVFIVRVFSGNSNGCGWTYSSGLMAAAEQCRKAGATIINMSLGGPGAVTAERVFFQDLLDNHGIQCVAAAGNTGSTRKAYPASYPAVISVAAVNSSGNLATFSQQNDQVDLAAPGVSIQSIRANQENTDNLKSLSGTSMATPYVTGIALLLKQAFPNKSWTTIRNAMESEAQDKGNNGRDNSYGHGILKGLWAWNCLDNPNNCSSSNNGGGGGGGGGTCTDTPAGWYDSDGATYNCEWYGLDERCSRFGDSYHNFGATANEACCVCKE